MSDPLSSEFDVALDGITYTFRKPGIRYTIELGYRAADVRRRAFPAGGGVLPNDFGIDRAAVDFSRLCAILELYLVRSTVPWPFGTESVSEIDWARPPKVDFEKFPPGREDTVDAVAAAFAEGLARFRKGGDTDGRPAGAEAVGGVGGAGCL